MEYHRGRKFDRFLFILYINDVVESLNEVGCKCKLFAVDMMIHVSSGDLEIVQGTLNEGLKKLLQWLNVNSLKINVKESFYGNS